MDESYGRSSSELFVAHSIFKGWDQSHLKYSVLRGMITELNIQ